MLWWVGLILVIVNLADFCLSTYQSSHRKEVVERCLATIHARLCMGLAVAGLIIMHVYG